MNVGWQQASDNFIQRKVVVKMNRLNRMSVPQLFADSRNGKGCASNFRLVDTGVVSWMLGWTISVAAMIFSCSYANAQTDRNDNAANDSNVVELSTTVTGNQEQPRVIYVVPWKPAEDNALLYRPLNSQTSDNIFGHVERSEHKRELKFIKEIEKK